MVICFSQMTISCIKSAVQKISEPLKDI